jgi:endonuclease/exonuclease/phosphatase family metal-dependent hydrolase
VHVQARVAALLACFVAGCAADDGDAQIDLEAQSEQVIFETADGTYGGTFSTLTYNVAGLLEPFSSANPSANTPIISCMVRDYDIVAVQEDFNYHAALYDSCDDHPYRSSTSGGMGVGSGLNMLSRFSYTDFDRTTWRDRSGSDAWTPKGFTISRLRMGEGVYLDVYNLHAQSEVDATALANSRSNMKQLLSFIESESAGNAVIVMGDTNTRYTREGQTIGDFLKYGFRDVWIDLVRGGVKPALGSPPLTSCANTTSPECEIVDKVLYRNNRNVRLVPLEYKVESERFVNAQGESLSDHWPVSVTWRLATASEWRFSDSWGGPHGSAFNDLGVMPANPAVSSVALRSGSRVDEVEITLSNGFLLSHGGSGGNLQTLRLAPDEFLTSLHLCSGQKSGHTRISYAKFTTNTLRTLSGGTITGDCTSHAAPPGFQIVGFHGRAGDEVDRLGIIYAPRLAGSAPKAPAYLQYINRLNKLCLDVEGAKMAAGTNVLLWYCNGGAWQRWNHDPASGLVRSLQDPRYCLDASDPSENGSQVTIWPCTGNVHQQFELDAAAGTIRMRANPSLTLDAYNAGMAAGTNVVMWTDWGGANQSWSL